MNLERFVIFVAAGFFLLYGLAFGVSPENMAQIITGSKPDGVSALVDFRATYGGMTIAVGISIFYLYSKHQTRACLAIVAIVLISMAAARTIGFFVHGSGNPTMYLYLILELLGSSLAVVAMRERTGAA